jgi:hypothetical protein
MSVEHVDTTKSLEWNINELYINGFDPQDIAEILGITLLRVAEYLAPLGLHFPEFGAPVRFDSNGRVL